MGHLGRHLGRYVDRRIGYDGRRIGALFGAGRCELGASSVLGARCSTPVAQRDPRSVVVVRYA
jgi:hypothetical protein